MTKIDGLEIVMTKHIKSEIDKELKKRFEELKPDIAKRYEELLNMRNMETDQFNDGFNDARAGKLETDHPHYDLDTDNWRLGYAWGMFEPMKEKLARERQVSDALYLLLVDDPNTKLLADQILINIFGKCEPSPSDVSVTQDVLMDIKTGQSVENTNPDYYKEAEKTALIRLCGVLGVLTENNDLATAALLAATRIERLEKKIPSLNVDLAEASMHAYNGEVSRMNLEAELARRDEIIARLKEDGDSLASVVTGGVTQDAEEYWECPYCMAMAYNAGDIHHTPDCPITLHRALMTELNQTGELK